MFLFILCIDWVCGGQWNRMVSFLTNFVNSLRQSNIHVVVFFNGAFEEDRFNEWVQKQEETRNRANAVSPLNYLLFFMIIDDYDVLFNLIRF